MPWEVEQKFSITSEAELAAKLTNLGVQLGQPIEQIDNYFNHPCRNFAVTDEALRLRQIGDQNFITYKGPKIDPATKTRREIELPLLPGPDAANHHRELLVALGFQPSGAVTKTRRSGSLVWQGFEAHIAWDDVATLGKYLELEIVADEANLASAQQAILALQTKLALGSSERRSYLELLLISKP